MPSKFTVFNVYRFAALSERNRCSRVKDFCESRFQIVSRFTGY